LSYWFDVESSVVGEDCTDDLIEGEVANLLLRGEIDRSSAQAVCKIDAVATAINVMMVRRRMGRLRERLMLLLR
jgi:hypothetical protein